MIHSRRDRIPVPRKDIRFRPPLLPRPDLRNGENCSVRISSSFPPCNICCVRRIKRHGVTSETGRETKHTDGPERERIQIRRIGNEWGKERGWERRGEGVGRGERWGESSRGLLVEQKTRMLHLCREYSWVTVHSWQA